VDWDVVGAGVLNNPVDGCWVFKVVGAVEPKPPPKPGVVPGGLAPKSPPVEGASVWPNAGADVPAFGCPNPVEPILFIKEILDSKTF
jgi:hypothetical protein